MPELDPQIAAALLGGGIALVLWALGSRSVEKAAVRESLRSLDDYQVDNVRDQELLVPLAERAFKPVLLGLTGLGRRLTPVGYVEGVRHKFVLSGRPSAQMIDRFLALRVVTVVAAPLSVWFFF
ncbi:MAG: hypothetical protein ACPHJY_14525, partial [Acidimicrobiales bacterium]